MIKKTILTSVLATLIVNSSVIANEAKTGLVLGLYGGYGMPTGWLKEKTRKEGGVSTTTKKKSYSPTVGALLGYDFALDNTLSVGAEADFHYIHNQKYDISSIPAGVTGNSTTKMYIGMLFLTGKFYVPGTNGLNLFAKSGYGYNRLHFKHRSSALNRNQWVTLYRPVVAGGIGYNIKDVNIFAQAQYNFLPYHGNNGGYATLSLGASYTFAV